MKSFKSIINSSFTTWILIIFIVLALGFYLLIDDSIINFLFEGNPTKTKADLLTIYLGVIGGFGVFYGFYINNKKLEEQNKQNKIAEQNRNDKIFNDAIVALKDSSLGIALSGAKMLFQLAQNDIFYKEIVATIFCECMDKTSDYYKEGLSKALVKYLFQTDVFKNLSLEIKNAEIDHLNKEIISFEKIVYYECKITNAIYIGIPTVQLNKCKIGVISFSEVSNLSIEDSEITYLYIFNNYNILKWLFILDCKILEDSTIKIYKQIKGLYLNSVTISKTLKITCSTIESKTINRITGNLII